MTPSPSLPVTKHNGVDPGPGQTQYSSQFQKNTHPTGKIKDEAYVLVTAIIDYYYYFWDFVPLVSK